MFVYFSFFLANAFHQTSVPRYVLAGGYKRCVHAVCNFSLPVRLSCSHAGCILRVLSANSMAFSKPPLLFKAQPDVFLSPPQVKAKPCQAGGVQLPVWNFVSRQSTPIQTTIIISWNTYTITGNVITNIFDVEGLEQWSSKKSEHKSVKETLLITMKCYKYCVST